MTARLAPWDRRPDESAPAFEAFAAYRDAGRERSIEAVSAALGKSGSLLSRWSAKHGWVERVAAFDTEAARRAGKASLEDHAAVRARQAKQARILQQRAMQALVGMDPALMTPAEAINALRVGSEQERAALGIPSQVRAELDVMTTISFEYHDAAPSDATDDGDVIDVAVSAAALPAGDDDDGDD